MSRDRPPRLIPALLAASRGVRRRLLRHRRGLAALFAGVAVLTGVRAATAEPPASVPVLVAAADLPAGTVLADAHLEPAGFLPGTPPAGSTSAYPDLVGRTLAAPVRDGEPVTDARLVGAALVAADPGAVALPVRFPDGPTVALLRTGDRIDVVATDPRGRSARRIASGVPVLAVPSPGDGVDPGAAGGTSGLGGRLVVLGVPDEDLMRISRSAVGRILSWAWSR